MSRAIAPFVIRRATPAEKEVIEKYQMEYWLGMFSYIVCFEWVGDDQLWVKTEGRKDPYANNPDGKEP